LNTLLDFDLLALRHDCLSSFFFRQCGFYFCPDALCGFNGFLCIEDFVLLNDGPRSGWRTLLILAGRYSWRKRTWGSSPAHNIWARFELNIWG
jgi:hypothetical protein